MYTDYFLDSENLSSEILADITDLDKSDKFYIFYSDKSQKPNYNVLNKIIRAKCQVELIECKNGTPNSMDFKIVSFIGLKIGSYKNMKKNKHHYIILSNDKGYDTTVEFYKSFGILIERWGNLLKAASLETKKARDAKLRADIEAKKEKEKELAQIRATLSSDTMYDTIIRDSINVSKNLTEFHTLLQKSSNTYIKQHATLIYHEYRNEFKKVKE